MYLRVKYMYEYDLTMSCNEDVVGLVTRFIASDKYAKFFEKLQSLFDIIYMIWWEYVFSV